MRKQVLLVMMSVVALVAGAYTPNTKWPYVYENFAEGTLYSGKDYSVAQFNIHYMGNVLHYISPEDDKIYTAKGNDVDSVVIADKIYMLVDHKDGRKMMEVVAQSGENKAFRLDYVDFDAAMQSGGGAYGSSSNSSATRNLSSLDLGGMNNPKHGLLLQEKNDGKSLVVRSRYYLRIGKFDIEANKKAVEQIVPAEKEEEWKQFLKKNKIKWKKPESLLQVLEFFK